MRKILLAMAAATLPASMALAEQAVRPKPDSNPAQERLLPLKRHEGNDCAAYGPGFSKIGGTGTCVKAGGSISIEMGTPGSHPGGR
jgi:uncharacterized membrane protein